MREEIKKIGINRENKGVLRKLKLNKETIRELSNSALNLVVSGGTETQYRTCGSAITQTDTCPPTHICQTAQCNSVAC